MVEPSTVTRTVVCANAPVAVARTKHAMVVTQRMARRIVFIVSLLCKAEPAQGGAWLDESIAVVLVPPRRAIVGRSEKPCGPPDHGFDRGWIGDALADEQRGDSGDMRRRHRCAFEPGLCVAVEPRRDHPCGRRVAAENRRL